MPNLDVGMWMAKLAMPLQRQGLYLKVVTLKGFISIVEDRPTITEKN
jgi:hypothetical protein